MNPFKKRGKEQSVLILDTCALIDGRIVDIAQAGFVPRDIVIPQFIIAELQFLADHGDSHKRERARFGLDMIRSLQELRRTNVSIAREQFKNIREVDDKLIALAKQMGGMLYTTDYNLNKVAQIEGVTVLNVNELAQALRPPRLPGERVELKITQVGQDKTQGVGYLEDGTMVVVEKAGKLVGQRISVQFSRMLQTQAGKMMFATLPGKMPEGREHAHEAHQQHHQPLSAVVAPVQITESPKAEQKRPAKQHRAQPYAKQRPQKNVKAQAQPQADQSQPQVAQPRPERKHLQNNQTRNQPRLDQPRKQQGSNRPQQRRKKAASPEDALLDAISRSEQ